MKTLYILMGLKGSGKTYIGKLVEDKFSIPFVRVEIIFKNIKADRHLSDKNYIQEGFTLLEKEIRRRFETADELIIESTGLTDEFRQMLESLRKDFSVKLIKIEAKPELCLQRVKERDNRDHINVSDADVEKINELAKKVNFEYDLVIDNNIKTEKEILNDLFKNLKYKLSNETQ